MKGSLKKFRKNVNPSHSSSSSRTPVIKIDLEYINRLNKTVDEALDTLIDYLDNNLGSLGKTKRNQPRGSPQSTTSHPIGSSQPTSLDLLEPNRSTILQFAEIGVKMGMKEVIAKVLENVGKSHWMLVGFLCLGVAVDCVITKYPNDYQCRILLESMLITAKKLRKVKGPMEEDTLKHALQIIIENAVICMDYLKHSNFLRFLQAKTMEEHLKSSNQELQRLLGLLNFDIGIKNSDLAGELAVEIKKLHQAYEQAIQGTKYAQSKVKDLLECSPVGIEDDVQCIASLLKNDINGSPFILVIHGPGGMGKSTLARASIQKYERDCVAEFSELKFSKIVANDNPKVRDEDIKMKQRILLEEITGSESKEFANAEDGRQALRLVFEQYSCLIFIDNINDKGYVHELLPRELSLQNNKVLKVIVTSRTKGVECEIHFRFHKEEHEVKRLSDASAKQMLRDLIWKAANNEEDVFPNETRMVNEVAELCHGCPLLLSIYGNHMSQRRDEREYRDIMQDLQSGDFRRDPNAENVANKIFFVYHKLKSDLQQAFMLAFHVGYYFLSHPMWEEIELHVPKDKLTELQRIGLVKREDNNLVIHDILRVMAVKEYFVPEMEEDDDKPVKKNSGIERCEGVTKMQAGQSLMTIHINNGWLQGSVNRELHNLRCLSLYNVDASSFHIGHKEFPKLTYFKAVRCRGITEQVLAAVCMSKCLIVLRLICNRNGNDETEIRNLPESFSSLKYLRDLQLRGLPNLEQLPEFHFPHLRSFQLYICAGIKKLPKRLCMHSSLEMLYLDSLETLEEIVMEDIFQLTKLKRLTISRCPRLSTRITKGFYNLVALECCHFGMRISKWESGEGLWERLTALTRFNLDNTMSENQVELPQHMVKLPVLQVLFLAEPRLQALPADFCHLQALKEVSLWECSSLKMLPESLESLKNLVKLILINVGIEKLPDDFSSLISLRYLEICDCDCLKHLPHNFGDLQSLQTLNLRNCKRLNSLSPSFGQLNKLKYLNMRGCINLPKECLDVVMRQLPEGVEFRF